MPTQNIAIIPARYASTRFPGKPLTLIAGKTMIQRVCEQASQASTVSRVIVATDDQRIFDEVQSFGGEVLMTSPDHASGTDRLAEVAKSVPEAALIVNVQGDEPLINPASIDLAVRRLLDEPRAGMSTLYVRCPERDIANPNVSKVVLDDQGLALYFSRATIPYERVKDLGLPIWKHIGLYAYRREFLLEFATWPPSRLEQTEGLEQLRALERGDKIACALSPYDSIGVDTPEDVQRVEATIFGVTAPRESLLI